MLKITQPGQGKDRKITFSSIDSKLLLDIPNLIEVQKAAYRSFLQADLEPHERAKVGLQEVFLDIFPIQDFAGKLVVEFIEYSLGLGRCKNCPELKKGKDCLYHNCYHEKERDCRIVDIDNKPYRLKWSANDCRKRHITYGVPLQMKVQLINKDTGEIKEQEIFMVNLPIITDQGTFIINGAERVIVSQLHRSPGVYFSYDKAKKIYGAKIVPYRGAWIEFEVDVIKDIMYVRLDRKRKQPVTVLLRALGSESNKSIVELFNGNEYIKNTLKHDKTKTEEEALKEIYTRLRPGEPFTEDNARAVFENLFFNHRKYDLADVGRFKTNSKLRLNDRIRGKAVAENIVDTLTGELIAEAGVVVDEFLAIEIDARATNQILKFKTAEGIEFEVIKESDNEYVKLCEERRGWEDKIVNWPSAENVFDTHTGEIVVEFREVITPEIASRLKDMRRPQVTVIKNDVERPYSVKDYDYVDSEAPPRYYESDVIKKILVGRIVDEQIIDRYGDVILERGTEIKGRHIKKIKDAGIRQILVKQGRVLSSNDIIAVIRYLLDLCNGVGVVDDIDHLGNRRIRRSGELLQNQLRMSLSRMESDVRERMTIQDITGITPQNLINTRPIASAVKDFFGTSQLSQFMDQTNPLSELTHKRRLSALGPGGLKRERAGYEVRDVHPTHYGRVCPIETPEGPNAGLIGSLAIYARINEFGFVETPLAKVSNGVIDRTVPVKFFDSYQEDAFVVCSSDTEIDSDGKILAPMVPAKFVRDEEHEFAMMDARKVDYIRVSPLQMVSVAAALIPFLEHDDANRALMGTNMQRQAVPLVVTDSAYVGTGLENRICQDSGSAVISRHKGKVLRVTADSIEVVRYDGHEDDVEAIKLRDTDFGERIRGCYAAETLLDPKAVSEEDRLVISEGDKIESDYVIGRIKMAAAREFKVKACRIDVYELLKFRRSNQGTCFNQRVIVHPGQFVESGSIIADGPACSKGELALGKNVLGAFMPWEGYNYEDAILLSERTVSEDLYTSIHIEEHEIEARDTKLGEEEITRDIPNVSEEALAKLDERGIVKIGAEVEPGDILVGKVTPKGVTELTAEEKLLRAIFGEKAREVRNTSYTLPHGERGKVVDIMEFSRANKDELPHGVNRIVRVLIAQKRKISEGDKMAGRHGNKGVISKILPVEDMPHLADGTSIDIVLNPLGVPSRMNLGQILETHLGYALDAFGLKASTDIFKSVPEDEIKVMILWSDIYRYNRIEIADRKTGKPVAYLACDSVSREEIEDIIQRNADFYTSLASLLTERRGRILDIETRQVLYRLNPKASVAAIRDALEAGVLTRVFDRVVPSAEELEDITRWYNGLETMVLDPEAIRERKEVYEDDPEDPEEEEEDSEPYGRKNYPMKVMEAAGYSERELVSDLPAEFFEKMEQKLNDAELWRHETGKRFIFDGRTGEAFENPVTVGHIYMLKLAHLVEDKIHARATGPYSLVTQQPLGGKAQFGGQRFGEMEVWALEAYGAAHVLQEFLTVKSDDVEGRVDVYETLIKNENKTKPRIPEAFNVLVSELRSLGLKIDLISRGEAKDIAEVKRQLEADSEMDSAEEAFSGLFRDSADISDDEESQETN